MPSTPILRRSLTQWLSSFLGWAMVILAFLPLRAGGSTSITVWVNPASATLLVGTTQQFSATVQGTTKTAVTWSCTGGTITSTGLYTAPSAPGTYTVQATLVANTSKFGTASVTVVKNQIDGASLSVSASSVGTSQSVNLTAVVTGSGDLSGTWSFSDGTAPFVGGSSSLIFTYGTNAASNISHTMPATPGTYTITFTPTQNPIKSASTTITVVAPGVSISPTSVAVAPGSTQQFTASTVGFTNTVVTWSCSAGSISSTGLYTAPTAAGSYTVTATSVQNPAKSATATATVAFTITLDPVYSPIYVNSAYTFSATVNGTSSTAVAWSCTGGVFGASTTSANVTRIYWIAPSVAGHYTITATSVADPARSVSIEVPVALKVQVTAPIANLVAGGIYQAKATVTGTTDTRVVWSIDPSRSSDGGGITPDGLFTAPTTTPVGQTLGYYLKATSVADPSQNDEKYLGVYQPAAVTLSPASATLPLGGSLPLTATVVGSSAQPTYIAWEPSGGSMQFTGGTYGNFRGPLQGTYVAPRVPGTYRVRIAPVNSNSTPLPGVSAVTSLNVVQAAAQVALLPGQVAIETGGTQQYLASVTGVVDPTVQWSCTAGSIDANGLYTAPGTAGTYTITATSALDPSGKFSVPIIVRVATAKPKITVTPKVATISTGATQQVSATLSNVSSGAVAWYPSINGGAFTSSGSTGSFTAPATLPQGQAAANTLEAVGVWSNQSWIRNDLFDQAIVTVQTPGAITLSLDPTNRYEFIQGEKSQLKASASGAVDTRVIWSGALVDQTGALDTTLADSNWFTNSPYFDATICAASTADSTRKAFAPLRVWAKGAVRVFGPQTTSILPGQQVQLDVEVKGGGGVVWSADAGTISPTGLYTAPPSVTADTTVTIRATNALNPALLDTIWLSIRATGSVDVSPISADLYAGGKQTFTAKVWNSTASVNWSVRISNGLALDPGTISRAGVYTAPSSLNSNESCRYITVRATNALDPSKWNEANVTVRPKPTSTTPPPPVAGTLYLNGVTSLWTGTTRMAYYDGGGDTVTWSITGGTILSSGMQEFGFPPMWYVVYQAGAAAANLTLTAKASNAGGSVSVTSAPVAVTAVPDFAGIFTTSMGTAYSILDFGTVTETRTDGTKVTYRKVWANGTSGSLQGNDLSIGNSVLGAFSSDAQIFNLSGVSAPVPANRTAGIIIGVDPASGAYVKAGSTLQFYSGMGGTANKAVTWTCSGGNISASGLYTPPVTPGTYMVTATSQADVTKSYTVKVGMETGDAISGIAGVFTGTTTYAGTDPRTYPVSVFTDAGTTYVKLYGVNTFTGANTALASGTLMGRTFQGTFYEYNPSWYDRDGEPITLVFERQADGSMAASGGYQTIHGFPSPTGGITYGSSPVWAAFSGAVAPSQVDVAVVPRLQDGYYGISYDYGLPQPHVMSGAAMSFKGLVCGSSNGVVNWAASSGATGSVPAAAFSTATGNNTVFTVPQETAMGVSYAVKATSAVDATKADAVTFPVDTTNGLISANPLTVYLKKGLDPNAVNGYYLDYSSLSVNFPQAPSNDATWSLVEPGDSGSIQQSLYSRTYVPGNTPGIYTVRAVSKWDPTRTATQKLTVVEMVPTLLYGSIDKTTISSGDTVTLSWMGAWAFNTPTPAISLTITDTVTHAIQVVDVTNQTSYTCAPAHSVQFLFTVTSASGKQGTQTFYASVDATKGASLYLSPNPVGFQSPLAGTVFYTQGTARLAVQTGSYSWMDLGPAANGAAIQIDPSLISWTTATEVDVKAILTDASGNTGTITASAPIKPRIVSFTSSVPGLLTGALQPVTLAWSINSANRAATLSLVATNSKGSFALPLSSGGATMATVTPTETTTYTLTVTTYYGGIYASYPMTDQASLTVKVGSVASLQVTPAAAKITPGETLALTGSILALPGSDGVIWSASAGTITSSGLTTTYLAPSSQGVYTVTVKSVVDPTVSATATITVWYPPVTLSITPTTTVLNIGTTMTFGHTILLTGSTNGAVTWSVQEGAMGGSITPSGYYTAPAAPGVFHVVVASQANPAITAVATVTVVLPDVQVAISPSTLSLVQGATYQFGFSSSNGPVTWSTSGGTVTPDGLYIAPAATGTYTVTATSALNPADTASATVTVTLSSTPSLQVTPGAVNLFPGGQQIFKATVLGLSNTAVSWSVLGTGSGVIGTDGTYTAPTSFGSYTIQAASVQDGSIVGTAHVNIANLVVTPSTAILTPGGTQAFLASLAQGASGPVSWSVSEGSPGGSIAPDGTYTAPMANGVFHLVGSLPDGSLVTVPIQVGLANDLVVGLPMQVMLSGTYRITAQLKGSNGNTLSQSADLHLQAGNATPELKFLASDIRKHLGVDGPWEVVDAEVEYQDPSEGGFVPSDAAADLGSTSPYLLRQFRQPWASLTGDFQAAGVTISPTGTPLTGLQAQIGVNLLGAGTYQVGAVLVDVNGNRVATVTLQTITLPTGNCTITVVFPGSQIAQSQAAGPYSVSELTIIGPTSLVLNRVGTISGYTWSQFQ